jgi:hypothetical protein
VLIEEADGAEQGRVLRLLAAAPAQRFTDGRLPAGLQILARPNDELFLFRLAYAYEQGIHHRVPAGGFPALRTGGRTRHSAPQRNVRLRNPTVRRHANVAAASS